MPTTSTSFDSAFDQLLSLWNLHHELRVGGASINRLASSRAELDGARSLIRNIH